MKNPFAGIVKMFQPKYSVVVNMYHVIPGNPIQKVEHKHEFDKGALDEATMYFTKIVRKHSELGFPNTEVQLVKGRKTVIQTKKYGPVDLVKNLNVKSA